MPISYIILCSILVMFGILGLIGILMRISKQAKQDLLETMFKDGDININVYKKYL